MARPIVNTPEARRLLEEKGLKPVTPESERAKAALRKRQDVVDLAKELAELLDTALQYWPSGGHHWRRRSVTARDTARNLKGD